MPSQVVRTNWLKRVERWRRTRPTLRTRIAVRLAIALLPLCLAAEIAQYTIAVHNQSLRDKALVARGETILASQGGVLQEMNALLDTVSILLASSPSSPASCNETFRRIVAQHRDISSLRFLAPDGSTICRGPTPILEGTEIEPAPTWIATALEAQNFTVWAWSELASSDVPAGEMALVAALPVYDADKSAKGVLALTFSFRALAVTTQVVELRDASALALLDARGTVLTQRTKGAPVGSWLPRSLVAETRPSLMSGTFVQKGLDDATRTYVISSLPGNIFGLYAEEPDDPSIAARALLYFVIAFPLLVWIAASFLAGRAAERSVIDPLNRVRKAIRRYIAGDETARVDEDPDAPEEVQAVANKFNTMVETIQARDDALRAALEHQKALVREVNHRVRNNLQVMNSLLNLQSRRAKTPEQMAIFLDIQRRLNALGIVHAALYKGDDFRAVDLGVLLKDLCQSTERHLSTEWGRPVLTMRSSSTIFALPDAALTLAFLVTELIAAATVGLSPEGHPATQIDFDLNERPEGGSTLVMKVDQPVLGGLLESRPDEGHINLFRGLIRQLRAHMDVDADHCLVTVTMPVLV
ncbi:signal transduction histidine kinase [Parvibaculum lavamentivorans DS-1]|uniref:histidine kinase n=1 Tax=Parvibaculum lavamentivorans (strain DS-1 / DSM 13023 / NCIMB 13966) TaxID=402881 RepID=A7HP41_PARL1|nr:histidine kinase dimerization/phosphoacceptor domain -containing protein [Parvibaculum lavamentivorans]ABS61674.1 signal transduction histidine kinase [Parvibaculum lavamentivorans DS-1]